MISIIIPTFNRVTALKRCLESVIAQQLPNLEVIVIDDFSTDGTKEYLKKISEENANFKIIFNNFNAGVNYTRNRGIERATQPYILFLDSDDAFIPNTIKGVITAIENNPKTDHFLSYLSYRSNEFKNLQTAQSIFYEQWMSGKFNGDFTHILRTSIMKDFLFFEEFRMFEQLNWYRILRKTSPQLLLPFAVADIDLNSTDSLMRATKAKTWEAVNATFNSEAKFYALYADDLAKYNPKYLRLKLIQNVLLGMACKKRNTAIQLLQYAKGLHIKLIGYFIILFPYWLIRYIFIKTGRVR